jgi:hypothetical protein
MMHLISNIDLPCSCVGICDTPKFPIWDVIKIH